MITLLLTTLVLVLEPATRPSTVSAEPAPPKRFEIRDAEWRHEPSGVVFPQRLAEFRREHGTVFHGNPANICVLYTCNDPNAVCDIYVYAHNDDDLVEHFKAVIRDIRRSWDDVKILESVLVKLPLAGEAEHDVAHARFTCQPKGRPDDKRYSEFALTQNGRFFVKYRITGRAADAEAIQKSLAALLVALELPAED